MTDMEILKAQGVSTEAWKLLMDKPISDIKDQKLLDFLNNIYSRAQDGIQNNLKPQVWSRIHGIDLACDSPLKSVAPTLMSKLSRKRPDGDTGNWLSKIKDFGLDNYYHKTTDPKTGAVITEELDVPSGFELEIPTTYAYSEARAGRLYMDRNQVPFLKYEPQKDTPELRAKCEIVTDRINLIADQMGLPEHVKECCRRLVRYPEQLWFIGESWYQEEQWHYEKAKDGTVGKKKVVIREGIRPVLPHPTRSFRDRSYPATTILTDTGCKFGGYWQAMTYGEIRNNKAFWNRDNIMFGDDLRSNYSNYWANVYGSCALEYPMFDRSKDANQEPDSCKYTSNRDDAAVTVINYFCKFTPKDVGLGKYDCEIWARFVLGNRQIIFAEPLPSIPMNVLADRYDSGRVMAPSFAMLIVPFQDIIKSLISQANLSGMQNQTALFCMDESLLSEETKIALKNPGESYYRGINWLFFDSAKAKAKQLDPRSAFFTATFPYRDVTQLINLINVVINQLQTVLHISPQEMGGQASHEQSTVEITTVNAATTTSLGFTGTTLDAFLTAMKRMYFSYFMAFGDDVIWQDLTPGQPMDKQVLTELGFEVKETKAQDGTVSYTITGKKSNIATPDDMEFFSSRKEGALRTSNTQIAGAMSQVLMSITNNQMLLQAIGIPKVVELLNQVWHTLGLPEDFKLTTTGAVDPQQQLQEQQQQLQQMAQQVLQQSQQQTQQMMEPEMQQIVQHFQQIDQQLQLVTQQQGMAQLAATVGQTAQQVGQLGQFAQATTQQLETIQTELTAVNQSVAQTAQAASQAVAEIDGHLQSTVVQPPMPVQTQQFIDPALQQQQL